MVNGGYSMRNKTRILSALALALGLMACTKPKRSPDELIAFLSTGGASITKDGAFTNEPPAEMNTKLVVDGESGFTARRFPDPKLASDYCETMPACFSVDHWSVNASNASSRGPGWSKLLAAAGKPASSAPRQH
jgi:hypothetical protein